MLKETDCVGTRLLYTMGVNIQKLYSAVLAAAGIDTNAIPEELQMPKEPEGKNRDPQHRRWISTAVI